MAHCHTMRLARRKPTKSTGGTPPKYSAWSITAYTPFETGAHQIMRIVRHSGPYDVQWQFTIVSARQMRWYDSRHVASCHATTHARNGRTKSNAAPDASVSAAGAPCLHHWYASCTVSDGSH